MTENLNCSFCGKSHRDVRKLVAGPNNISICNECIDLCIDITHGGPIVSLPVVREKALTLALAGCSVATPEAAANFVKAAAIIEGYLSVPVGTKTAPKAVEVDKP